MLNNLYKKATLHYLGIMKTWYYSMQNTNNCFYELNCVSWNFCGEVLTPNSLEHDNLGDKVFEELFPTKYYVPMTMPLALCCSIFNVWHNTSKHLLYSFLYLFLLFCAQSFKCIFFCIKNIIELEGIAYNLSIQRS